jgi:hypothetical protein
MDLKNELENEVLLAILTQKRLVKGIEPENSRELVAKIKGALKRDELDISARYTTPVSALEPDHVH